MHPGQSGSAQVAAGDRSRQRFAVMLGIIPRLDDQAEIALAYLAVAALWGLLLYVALTYAMP